MFRFSFGFVSEGRVKMDQVSKAIISRFNWKDPRLPCTEFHVRRVYTCLNCTSFKFLKCIKAISKQYYHSPSKLAAGRWFWGQTGLPFPYQNSRFVSINHPPEAKPSHWTPETLLWLHEIHQSFQHWPFLKLEAFMKCIGKHPKPPHLILILTPTKRWKRWKKMEKFWGLGFFGKDMYNFSKNFKKCIPKEHPRFQPKNTCSFGKKSAPTQAMNKPLTFGASFQKIASMVGTMLQVFTSIGINRDLL